MKNNIKSQVISLLCVMTFILTACMKPVEGGRYYFEGDVHQWRKVLTDCEIPKQIVNLKKNKKLNMWEIQEPVEDWGSCLEDKGILLIDGISFALGGSIVEDSSSKEK